MSTPSPSIQPAVLRILDANLDRAREGLRIIEEWCRFALNDTAMANECKQMRQELGLWHTSEIRAARDTAGDVGTGLTHPREEQRTGIEQLLQANLCRVQEALRVLEEYAKLHSASMSSGCKQMRYRVYTLESNLLAYRRRQILTQAKLYLVTAATPDLLPRVEAALQGGLTLVQYRDKQHHDVDRLRIASQLCVIYPQRSGGHRASCQGRWGAFGSTRYSRCPRQTNPWIAIYHWSIDYQPRRNGLGTSRRC
jgi:thiamine-phosphate pyrophosphorylase